MKALITGACGFAGGHLVQHLVDAGDQVTGTFFREVEPWHPTFGLFIDRQRLDISSPSACIELIDRIRPDVIYHLAGMAFVPEAEENFSAALTLNVAGVSNMVRAASVVGMPCSFLFTSSAEVYGRFRPEELPLTESHTLKPLNNYSLSKAMAEMVLERYSSSTLKTVVIRPFNHIGPVQNDRFVVSSFAKQLAEISLGRRDSVMRVGNLSAQRDFTDVRDIVRGYRLAAMLGSGVYNFCSGEPVQMSRVLDLLIEQSGVSATIEIDQSRLRAVEIPVLYGSSLKAKRDLGWTRQYSLAQSLKDTYQFWLNQLSK